MAEPRPGTRLEVVIEPTGPAWLPIAVFFTGRGHRVYRVVQREGGGSAPLSVAAREDQRHRRGHPRPDPAVPSRRVHPLELARRPRPRRGSAGPGLRSVDPQARAAQDADQGAGPSADADDPADRQADERRSRGAGTLGRPATLLDAGRTRLTAVIVKASNGHHGVDRAQQWRAAAHAAVELYADHPAVAFDRPGRRGRHRGPAAARDQAELAVHAAEREAAYRLHRSGRPGAQPARTGRGRRARGRRDRAARPGSATGKQFRSFTGLAPRASETGDTDRKGQPMSKAGSVAAADHPRPRRGQRPQTRPATRPDLLHADGRTRRGPPQALCVVAAHLAERAWP